MPSEADGNRLVSYKTINHEILKAFQTASRHRTFELLQEMLKILLITFTTIVSCNCSNDEHAVEKYAIFPILPPGVTSSDNGICEDHSRIYRDNLDNFTLWAYEMWDSTAKTTVGTLKGSEYQMGNFDECISVKAPFPTQYCLVTITAVIPKVKRNDPLSLYHDPNESVIERLYQFHEEYRTLYPRNMARIGWCTPASCEAEDLKRFLENYLKEIDLPLIKQNHINYTVNLSNLNCQRYDDGDLDTVDILFCVLTAILILTAIIATILDVKQPIEINAKPVNSSLSKRVLLAFSIKSNYRSFLKIPNQNSPLNVLYGVRMFAILTVIFGHRALIFANIAVSNIDLVEILHRKFYSTFLLHSDLVVDSFFIMAGILVAYNVFNQFEKEFVNPALIILLRYLRLTPLLAYVVFFHATMMNHIGSGPLWKIQMTSERNWCRSNWWINLIYLNNFINVGNVCIGESWYLACDFQLFFLAIGICLLIYKNRIFGLVALVSLMLISMTVQFVLTYIYEQPAILFMGRFSFEIVRSNIDFNLTYTKPYTRATTYLIGLLAGYIFYKLKHNEKRIDKNKSYLIMIISIILMFSSIFGSAIFLNPYHSYNKLESAAFAALNRPIFALGSIGIFYVAGYGYGDFIYKILSWPPSIVLGKLSYGAYLIHMVFNTRVTATLRSSHVFDRFDLVVLAMSAAVLSFLVAFLLHLMIELPVKKICNELLLTLRNAMPIRDDYNNANNDEWNESKL